MKVSREQVAEHRSRILEAAGRLFREQGTEAISVAEVMKAVGLTHGAFYGHFKSKDDLIVQALAAAATRPPQNRAEYVDFYLSRSHRDDPGSGCFFASLAPELARADKASGGHEARHVLTERFKRHIDAFSDKATGETPAARRQAAIADMATMIGAMVLARVVDDERFSEEILAAARAGLAD